MLPTLFYERCEINPQHRIAIDGLLIMVDRLTPQELDARLKFKFEMPTRRQVGGYTEKFIHSPVFLADKNNWVRFRIDATVTSHLPCQNTICQTIWMYGDSHVPDTARGGF